MNDSLESGQVYSRKQAVQLLSRERGRSPGHPLHDTLISRWCAELGFEKGLAAFSPDQFAQLRGMNWHYASGGSRAELLTKMRRNPRWYVLKT